MNDNDYKVIVARDLEDLIPVFLKNRRKEVETLRVALAAADFEQLRQIGHRMRGVGNSYGFERVSVLGKEIQDAAHGADKAAIASHIAAYTDYLSRLHITYE